MCFSISRSRWFSGNLIFQAEVVEQRFGTVVLPHHDSAGLRRSESNRACGAHTVLKSDGGTAAFHVISRLLMGMFTARVIARMHIIATE